MDHWDLDKRREYDCADELLHNAILDLVHPLPQVWYHTRSDVELDDLFRHLECEVFKQHRACDFATNRLHMLKERSMTIEREQEFRAEQSMRGNRPAVSPDPVRKPVAAKPVKKMTKKAAAHHAKQVKHHKARQRDVKKQVKKENKSGKQEKKVRVKKAKKGKAIGAHAKVEEKMDKIGEGFREAAKKDEYEKFDKLVAAMENMDI